MEIKNNINKNINIDDIKVIQAPLAGISDIVFRKEIRKHKSKCLMTTEMISSEMLCNNPNPKIIQFDEAEYPLSFQLVGHKIDKMVKAAKIVAPFASAIDFNCGCPVKKVVVSGDGSAMMKTPQLASDIIKAIKDATGLPVSAKFRLGWDKNSMNYVEFGKTLEDAGADFIVLHARTRSELYSGSADWEKIKDLVEATSIPIYANGDIKNIEDAINCLKISGAKGIALGRGIMGDFTLPYRIEKYLEDGTVIDEPNLEEKIKMLKTHLIEEIENMGEMNGIKFMRKFYNYYIAGVKNASKYRSALVTLTNKDEILKTLDEILLIHSKNS